MFLRMSTGGYCYFGTETLGHLQKKNSSPQQTCQLEPVRISDDEGGHSLTAQKRNVMGERDTKELIG